MICIIDYSVIQLDFFNLTTTRFLRSHLFEELPEQVNKWYLYYSFWQDNLAGFTECIQSQFANLFESEFSNILDIQIPKTPATQKYTQTDEKVNINSRMIGSQRLAIAFNKLVNMVTGTENNIEKF